MIIYQKGYEPTLEQLKDPVNLIRDNQDQLLLEQLSDLTDPETFGLKVHENCIVHK